MAINIQIESSKLVKPSIPTPPNLRNYKIGFIDEISPSMHVSIVLFFSVNRENNPKFVARLEKSLEKTLTHLYPLAGRYVKEIHMVDCNDQGAEFIHSKVDSRLQDILDSQWNVELIDKLIPSKSRDVDQITNSILSIQVNTFMCGGVALGVSVSHRIADASTLSTFLNEWAALSREANEVEFIGPGFSIPALFPGRGYPPTKPVPSNIVTKKLSFSESEISNMKAQFLINEKNGTRHLSRVQLISAIIWKALINVDRAIHNHPRDSIIAQVLNLRGETASLIPKNSCGNLCVLFTTISKNDETTQGLAYLLNNSLKEDRSKYSKLRHETEEGQSIVLNSWSQAKYMASTANVVTLTSWCKFPFYEADFGFGKPTWVTHGSVLRHNSVVLFDGVGGNGVDAYVGIEHKAVPYFTEALDMIAIGTQK